MSAGSAATWHDDSDVPKIELLDACYRNDIRKVTESLNNGVAVDATDDDLVTPLQIAAFMGNRELSLLLLENGADLEATSRTGMTAFLHACREGKMEVIDLLLQKGADIMKFTRMGASALTLAAAGGHLEVIKKLVGLRVPVSESKDTCPTPLITSVFRNFSPISVYLISKGASVDAIMSNLHGLSALSLGVMFSSRSMLITLLDKGADYGKKTFLKRTAQELALFLKRKDAEKLFYERSLGNRTERKDIRQSLMEDDFDKEELLQQRKLRLPSGYSPLHFSVAIGNINAVRCLAADGQFLDEGDEKLGLSSLQIAALLGQSDVITYLLDRGASTVYLNQQKMTAFDYYISNGGESSDTIRSALHCFRPGRLDLNFSGSSNTLKKVFPSKLLSKKLFADKPVELPPVEARQWRETRMHTYPMHGRNYRKFVTVEDLLYQERALFPKKSSNDDTVMEVVRALATEAQSFLVTNFYDWYTGGVEKKPYKNQVKAAKEYDPAIANSILYSYPKSQPHKVQPTFLHPRVIVPKQLTDSSPESSSDTWRRVTIRYSETSSPNQSRQTPRMLKKSKDSLFVEGEKHELRKSVSTGQLHGPKLLVQQRVLPSATMVSYPVQDPKKTLVNVHALLYQSSSPSAAKSPFRVSR